MYNIDYNYETELFSLEDPENQEVIILRKEQLEALIHEWAKIFHYIIM